MKDTEGVQFLQWCLPRLGMRWPGFRKVRRQVLKRIERRMKELDISDVSGYRSYLGTYPAEWTVLDEYCRISISRFCRDKGVFQYLESVVLPEIATEAAKRGDPHIRCWSIGCAAGEEPYALAIVWKLAVGPRFPSVNFSVLATDSDSHALARAEKACYPPSSLRDLPKEWLENAFVQTPAGLCLREEYRTPVTFREQDIRKTTPPEHFHLIMCRNLAFTYFDDTLQAQMLLKIKTCLLPGGALVIGGSESLPQERLGFESWSEKARVFRVGACTKQTSNTRVSPQSRVSHGGSS